MLLPEAAAMAASMIEAKQIEQGLPGVEPPRTITFNGDFTGKEIFQDYFKISNEVLDLESIAEVVVHMVEGNTDTVYGKDNFTIAKEDEGLGGWIVIEGEGAIMALPNDTVETGLTKGTYALGYPGTAWVSRISIAETIHPIDPKYLPEGIGGGMDVEVNLDEYGFTIGEMIAEAFAGTGFARRNLDAEGIHIGTIFWNDLLSKKPYPVCVIEIEGFGTYKATPACMSENLAVFKMEAVYETYRLSVDTIIYKEPALGQVNVFVYVTTSPLFPQEG